MALLRNVALIQAFLAFITFCVLYFLRSRWQSTPVGRNAMALMAACGLALGLAIIRLFSGPEWFDQHRNILGFLSYGLIGAIVWWRVVLLIKVQRKPRGRAGRSPERPTRH